MSNTEWWVVTIKHPAPPTFTVPLLANGYFSLTISGDSGLDYRVLTTTNLVSPPDCSRCSPISPQLHCFILLIWPSPAPLKNSTHHAAVL